MVAIPTVVALRPVSSDARVGEHSAVVWNWVSRTPRSAIRDMVGICTSPPKQSQVAIPVSSQTRYKMLGAFSGAVGAAYGPQSASESRISNSILPLNSVDPVVPVTTGQPHSRCGPACRISCAECTRCQGSQPNAKSPETASLGRCRRRNGYETVTWPSRGFRRAASAWWPTADASPSGKPGRRCRRRCARRAP